MYEFKSVYPAYWAILHEVGHQFGMTHAHEPEDGSIVGHAEEVTSPEEGKIYKTTDSAMAFQAKIMYLSSDDRAGIKHLSNDVFEHIKSRVPNTKSQEK